MDTVTITESQAGCFLDNHRGHYIGRDAIQLAQGYGFIVGWFEQWAIDTYDDHSHDENYPNEGMIELCDHAVEWLNSGQTECVKCNGGFVASGYASSDTWYDKDNRLRCRICSGTGRGDRVSGQNFPPIVPDGYQWAFEDGDFGLWKYDDEGEFVIDQ